MTSTKPPQMLETPPHWLYSKIRVAFVFPYHDSTTWPVLIKWYTKGKEFALVDGVSMSALDLCIAQDSQASADMAGFSVCIHTPKFLLKTAGVPE